MSETRNLDTNKYVCRYLQWAPHCRTSTLRPCPPGTSTTTTTPWPPTPSTTRSGRRPRMMSSTPSSSSWSPPRSSPGSWPSSLFSVSGNIWHCSVSKSKFFSFFADVSFNRSARSFNTNESWRQNEVFGSWDQLQVTEDDGILIQL